MGHLSRVEVTLVLTTTLIIYLHSIPCQYEAAQQKNKIRMVELE